MLARPTLTAALSLLALLASVSLAAAECHGCGHGQYGFYRFYHSDRQIPYFAEFPPVYYSYPIPRTYGYSPYAYPASVMTPEVEIAPAPATIINPHVDPKKPERKKKATSSKTAAMPRISPRVVINPYFDPVAPVVHASFQN